MERKIEKKMFISCLGYIAHEWIERRRHTTSIPTAFSFCHKTKNCFPGMSVYIVCCRHPRRLNVSILAYVENYRVSLVCVWNWRVEILVGRLADVVVGGKVLIVFNTTNNYSENKSIGLRWGWGWTQKTINKSFAEYIICFNWETYSVDVELVPSRAPRTHAHTKMYYNILDWCIKSNSHWYLFFRTAQEAAGAYQQWNNLKVNERL